MNPPTKRLHYFDHQFLRVDDFTDEQEYHLGMRRAHNRHLHSAGVAYGLVLSPAGAAVGVSAGMAVDADGREIVLAGGTQVEVPPELAGKTSWLTIAYGERKTDATTETGAAGDRRWEEFALLRLDEAAPADAGVRLVLGRVTAGAGGAVTAIDDGEGSVRRRVAGPAPVPELELRRLAVAGLTAGTGMLTVDGSVGVGVSAPAATLHVAGGRPVAEGDLRVGTGANHLKVGVVVAGPAAGEARLRAEGAAPRLLLGAAGADVLTVAGTGVGIGTAPAAGSALTVGGGATIGGALAVTGSGLAVDTGEISSRNVITLRPNTDASGDTGLRVMHPGGWELFSVDATGGLGFRSGDLASLSVITLRPNTDQIGDTSVRVLHPSGTELLALSGAGNLTIPGRVTDAKVRRQAPIAYNRVSITSTVNGTVWHNVPGMSVSVPGGTFLILFTMGGVEVQGVSKAIADFRILIDGATQPVYVTETYDTGEWAARTVSMECLVTLAAGTHTVVAQWAVRSPYSPTTNPTLWGCWNYDHRSLIAIEL